MSTYTNAVAAVLTCVTNTSKATLPAGDCICDNPKQLKEATRLLKSTVGAVKLLVRALEDQQAHVLEMGCTCTSDQRRKAKTGHGRDCMGLQYSNAANRALKAGRKLLA